MHSLRLILFGIIETEGPVPVARSFRIYARACNLRRTGQQIQLKLKQALQELKRGNRVILEDELREDIVRVAGTGSVHLRERGPRTIEWIPPFEIAEQLRRIHSELPDQGADELYRELLVRYDLVRMTAPVRARLDRIARELLRWTV